MASNRGQGIVVIGGQWGDEGKGRIVDVLSNDCDVIVRFQGGNNAGHTLKINNLSMVLHIIPCGIMRKDKVSIIGNGVVIDPEVLCDEIEMLAKNDVLCTSDNLKIANNAHLIFPWHKYIDAARENNSKRPIGTTKRGIGPCYEDKVARFGITAKDLLFEEVLKEKIRLSLERHHGLADQFSLPSLLEWAKSFATKLAPFLCDTQELLDSYLRNGKRVLFEGAQGTLLDVDHGTYPFVTSSNCVAAQASIGSGIGMNWLGEVLMVSKAYCTRVGEGPFFTEGSPEVQERLRKAGQEFGATTGRPRRCGWLDLPALRYAARINGATGLILTKIDVLCGIGPIKVGTSYLGPKKNQLSFQEALDLYAKGEAVAIDYTELLGVDQMPISVDRISDLPKPFRQLCEMIEKIVDLPIRMVSYGAKRGQEFLIT